MPIIGLQRQMREIGRIRTGNQVEAKGGGRMIPNKLGTFRLTSSSPDIIAAAARVHGGEVEQWDNNGSIEWQVITETSVMAIVVPPGDVVSQWMELWSGGGCLRRCDGEVNQIDGSPCGSAPSYVGARGDKVIPPCPRDIPARIEAAKKGLACKTTTRLNVILPELPDLGVWRLDSHGYNAAVHLAGAADVLAAANERGMLIPAQLRLVEKSKKVPGQPTNRWYEPVIEFTKGFAELGLVAGGESAPRLGSGQAPALPQIAAPVSSDFRAPAPQRDEEDDATIEGVVIDPAGETCGWALRPQSGADIVCTFPALHPPGHSWADDPRRQRARVVPPA